MAHHSLDSLDKKILNLIANNARNPFLEVARACNVSGAAIHQRIAKLTAQGVLKGSEFIIDPERIGFETCAYVGLYLKHPEKFDEVVEKLNIIHDKLQPLGLSRSETIVSFNAVIDRQLPILDIPEEEEEENDDNNSDE